MLHPFLPGDDGRVLLDCGGGGPDQADDRFGGQEGDAFQDGEDGAGIILVLGDKGEEGVFEGFFAVFQILIALPEDFRDVVGELEDGVVERRAAGGSVLEEDGAFFEDELLGESLLAARLQLGKDRFLDGAFDLESVALDNRFERCVDGIGHDGDTFGGSRESGVPEGAGNGEFLLFLTTGGQEGQRRQENDDSFPGFLFILFNLQI